MLILNLCRIMRGICILLILTLFLNSSVYALDWKRLHEEADSKHPKDALISLQTDPDSLDALYVLGLVYLNNHRDKSAENIFKRMLILDNEVIEARWGIAEVLRRKKNIEKSQEILNKVIDLHPDFFPAYISLAYLKYTQTEFNEAIRLALKVNKQGLDVVDLSNYTRSYLIFAGAKGMIASSGGLIAKIINGTQVLPNLKKAEKLQPDSPAVLFGLGSFYFLAPRIAGGNPDKAVQYLEKAIKLDPLFVDAYVRLAQIYKARGQEEAFQRYLDKAQEIDPDNELLKDELSGLCKFNCVTVQE